MMKLKDLKLFEEEKPTIVFGFETKRSSGFLTTYINFKFQHQNGELVRFNKFIDSETGGFEDFDELCNTKEFSSYLGKQLINLVSDEESERVVEFLHKKYEELEDNGIEIPILKRIENVKEFARLDFKNLIITTNGSDYNGDSIYKLYINFNMEVDFEQVIDIIQEEFPMYEELANF